MDYALKDRRVLMYRCLQVYIEMNQPVMAASLCLELGNALKVKPHAEASQSCLTQSCNAWWSQVILWFSTGDGQTRRSYCALPEGCRAADTNAHWSTAVHGRHGHVQNPHPWVRPDALRQALTSAWWDSSSTGDFDGALSVFTDMQLLCQEKGLQLAGTNTPVGEEPWRPGGPNPQLGTINMHNDANTSKENLFEMFLCQGWYDYQEVTFLFPFNVGLFF